MEGYDTPLQQGYKGHGHGQGHEITTVLEGNKYAGLGEQLFKHTERPEGHTEDGIVYQRNKYTGNPIGEEGTLLNAGGYSSKPSVEDKLAREKLEQNESDRRLGGGQNITTEDSSAVKKREHDIVLKTPTGEEQHIPTSFSELSDEFISKKKENKHKHKETIEAALLKVLEERKEIFHMD